MDYLGLVEKLKDTKLPKLTWVCGDEPVLRELSINVVRGKLNPVESDFVTLFAQPRKPNPEVWAALAQHSVDAANPRLVVVRDAQYLDLSKLAEWLSTAGQAAIHAVFVSVATWPTDAVPEVRKRVVTSGLYVDVGQPKDITRAESRVGLLAEGLCVPLGQAQALYLARRARCDVQRVVDVCAWLTVLLAESPTRTITTKTLDALVPVSAAESFTEALVRVDRAAACAAIPDVQSVRGVLHTLAGQLIGLESVCRFLRTRGIPDLRDPRERASYIRDVAKGTGITHGDVQRFLDVAKYYDGKSVAKRCTALLDAYSAVHRPGVLEVLVAQW